MYRIVKQYTWWSSMFDTGSPQYLYWDERTDHFEIGSQGLARKHLWEFTKEDVDHIKSHHDDFDKEFLVEKVGGIKNEKR